MYTEEDLGKIAAHFRAIPCIRKQRPIREVQDALRFPNDVLMTYFISDDNPDTEEIVRLLGNPEELEQVLSRFIPRQEPSQELPFLYDSMNYTMPVSWISASIETRTGKFCRGYGDNQFGNSKLIVADKEEAEYVYPSGEKIKYSGLKNEVSANVFVLDGGYASENTGEIFIRDIFVEMMLALNDFQKDNPEFSDYKEQMEYFDEHLRGIVLAHEKCEIDIMRLGKIRKLNEELELKSESEAKKFLQENGVDLRQYELYHRLRAYSDERGKNISQLVVDRGF